MPLPHTALPEPRRELRKVSPAHPGVVQRDLPDHLGFGSVEVKLGKPTLEDVGETAIGMSWVMPEPPLPGMPATGDHEEEWIEIDVAVELQPWPDRNWLTFWQEEDLHWPRGLDEPVLDGRRLIFSAPEADLQQAWDAVKARVAATNAMYREEFELPPGEQEADRRGNSNLYAQLRELAQRRIDELT